MVYGTEKVQKKGAGYGWKAGSSILGGSALGRFLFFVFGPSRQIVMAFVVLHAF